MYEIGLVHWYDGSADVIVRGFSTMAEASREAHQRNVSEGRKHPPGHGSLGWMTARQYEIPQANGCTIVDIKK